ncbi:YesL family protein [Shouchella shacheensis]|uniref:YesL family protein n=1 Tax=Shouchella shacheensis TaxID=1649580 RepID=UPI00074029E5|nr:YesL family protein [Shouchella shacheensis]
MLNLFLKVSDWICRLVWVNILWLGGILAGLVVFGLMPATNAMHAVTREWARNNMEVSIYKTFVKTYKASFRQANLVGLLFAGMLVVLLVNLRLSVIIPGTLMMMAHYFILFVIFLLCLSVVMFFNLFAHYKYSWTQYVKQSIAFTVGSPRTILMLSLGFGLIAWLIVQMPGLLPFFSGVLPAYWSSIVCRKRFTKIEAMQMPTA